MDRGFVCQQCGQRWVTIHKCKGINAISGKSCLKCGFCEETNLAEGTVSSLTGNTIVYKKSHRCSKFNIDLSYDYEKAGKCLSYITKADYEQKCWNGEITKDNANIQIVIDFSSLKDVMSKGGLVMTTYKCPNCNAMVKIPEAGKVLMCEYCGTPIKPVDIFEKIKSLIQ
jgi:DNA-directed RNA polymerase subunit RPC12/RpoP